MHSTSVIIRLRIFALLASLLCFPSTSSALILFPVPKGKYAVGHNTAKLIDESRIDPYDPNHGKRNVMISLFYPIEHEACEQISPINYMPPTTAALFGQMAAEEYGVPNGTIETIRLQVCSKPSPRSIKEVGKYPLVLFSPGLTGIRLIYNFMAEKLASAGYAVATMDHTFEGAIVEYPDGTFTLGHNLSYWESPGQSGPIPNITKLNALLETRKEDSQFVLSQLGLRDVVNRLVPGASCAFNSAKAAFFGHSFGGATAISALMKDKRFAGAIDMDGTQYGNLTDTDKPAILFGRADPNSHNSTNDDSWPPTLDHLKGWKRELGLKDSGHLDFGDLPYLFKLGGIPVPDALKSQLGSLDGERAVDIITTYVQAFMDQVLKGKTSELFDGPSDAYPEIVFG